jgi:hypothetical protein
LGDVKSRSNDGKYFLPRTNGEVAFVTTWHRTNMKFAAKLLGRHEGEVDDILWDITVDGKAPSGPTRWHRRYYSSGKGKRRYAEHECFPAGHVIGLNCVVPAVITDDDFLELMRLAGQYKGLSPWKPADNGRFSVESIRKRRAPPRTESQGELTNKVEEVLGKTKKPTS